MNITIDTSAIIAVIVGEPIKHTLIEVTKGIHLIAPFSVQWEIGNAFSLMFKKKRMTLKDVLSAYESYQEIPIRYCDIDMSKALELSAKHEIYAYDSYIITCAQKYGTSLLSLDSKLTEKAKLEGIKIVEVAR